MPITSMIWLWGTTEKIHGLSHAWENIVPFVSAGSAEGLKPIMILYILIEHEVEI